MMSGVRDHYHKWLGRNQQSSPQAIAEIEVILRREDVFENWVRETHADCGAYDYACASSTFGGWIRGAQAAPYIMQVNINMALFFALFTVCEMWMQLRGARVDVTTHLTAAIRRSVFYHVQAERLGMSEQDFLFRQFGAGAAVDYILDRIVAEYMTARS
jgi:hypothetical protein